MAHVATLTIDHTKVAADLTDFPVAVIANGDAGWAELYAIATEGGGDIRIFKSDDTTELPREIVSFSVSAETGEIHIKYTGTLSGSVDTDIHIYADGSSSDYAVDATYGAENVWTDFLGVWHFNETSGTRNDSTANANHLTDNNTVGSAANKLGTGADFEASNSEYLNITSSSYTGLNFTGDHSFMMWLQPEVLPSTTGGAFRLITKDRVDGGIDRSYVFELHNAENKLRHLYYDNSGGLTRNEYGTALSAGTNYHIVSAVDVSAQGYTGYLNGSLMSTSNLNFAASSVKSNAQPFEIGADTQNGGLYTDGLMDEVRVKGSIVSASEATTTYNNQNSPATFYSVAVAETAIPVALTATAQATALVIKQMQEDLTVTASAVASFTRSIERVLQATAQATASFVRELARTLQVTAQASPTMQAGLLYATELIVTAQATASLVKTQVTIVALTVTAQASTAITQIYTRGVALVATAQAGVEIVRNSSLARTLTATASATASVLQSGLIISRTLVVTASATVTMTALKTLSYIMSVTVGSVVSLLKDFGYIDKYPENDATYEDKYPIE